MFLISKPIRDPEWPLPGNRIGRTIGFVFYTPKYWSCKDKTWDTEPHPSLPRWYTELEREEATRHFTCLWPYRHRSSKGYLYFIGPKRRYQFNYMGDVNPHNDNPPIFFAREHGQYVRWFDDGPQPEHDTTPEKHREFSDALTYTQKLHKDNGCLYMSHKFAECICDDANLRPPRMPEL